MQDDGDKDLGPTVAAVLANPELDSELANKLGRWFGSDTTDKEPEPESSWERVLRVANEAADTDLLDRLQHERRMTVNYEGLTSSLHRKQTGFKPRLELKLRIPELLAANVPMDIEDAMREANTPQAILRDLHRIEWDFDLEYFPTLIERPKAWVSTHRPAIDEALTPLESQAASNAPRDARARASKWFDDLRAELAINTTLGRKDDTSHEP